MPNGVESKTSMSARNAPCCVYTTLSWSGPKTSAWSHLACGTCCTQSMPMTTREANASTPPTTDVCKTRQSPSNGCTPYRETGGGNSARGRLNLNVRGCGAVPREEVVRPRVFTVPTCCDVESPAPSRNGSSSGKLNLQRAARHVSATCACSTALSARPSGSRAARAAPRTADADSDARTRKVCTPPSRSSTALHTEPESPAQALTSGTSSIVASSASVGSKVALGREPTGAMANPAGTDCAVTLTSSLRSARVWSPRLTGYSPPSYAT
mmetsp:Transcript_73443/g.203987  ORF Transcript_73443/g.203987 Transcript_73443/m.203987 type:complete len:269 (+) Transcript_73443:1059-1865(+)